MCGSRPLGVAIRVVRYIQKGTQTQRGSARQCNDNHLEWRNHP